ncbi:hypothetical protein V1498_20795 [Peribacillus sp. SCS-26]|uniref:hypothetical protein n=1 Tax=Paraperibacillus marinus TaxID=3115295 RepID=UPI003906BFE4
MDAALFFCGKGAELNGSIGFGQIGEHQLSCWHSCPHSTPLHRLIVFIPAFAQVPFHVRVVSEKLMFEFYERVYQLPKEGKGDAFSLIHKMEIME